MEFDYPIDYSLYNTEEITIIIVFLNTVERCYTSSVSNNDYTEIYKNFKNIVRAKSEENKIYKDFKEVTGYDGYKTTKMMREKVANIRVES